jgi:hypothetical protein
MIALLTTMFLSFPTIQNPESLLNANPPIFDTCKKGKDTLTGRVVYLVADSEPECEGGKAALLRKFNKNIKFPKSALTDEIQTQYIVAFIVETSGEVTGERVIQDNTKQIGKQLLDVIKSFRWYPAKCKGKKVAVLYKLPVIIDLQTD